VNIGKALTPLIVPVISRSVGYNLRAHAMIITILLLLINIFMCMLVYAYMNLVFRKGSNVFQQIDKGK